MREAEILDILEKTEALLTGHFKLSSGLHSNQYLQYALALQHPEYAAKFGKAIADKFKDKKIDCVIGPALGGIIIAHEVAKTLKTKCIFGEREKETDKMILRRGFRLSPREKVLIVEDVITTGRSVKELIDIVKNEGADVVGVGALAERSVGKIDFGCETKALTKFDIKTFNPNDCPLCKKGESLIKPGSRR